MPHGKRELLIMPYPPGISTRDLKRAGIITPPDVECGECGETIHEIADHKEWCEWKESPEEIRKRQAEPVEPF
jgi:hypothetical protein